MVADLLYYIMDYRGHYYRSDMTNELVVAEDENDASMFTFAQANNKIGTGKKSSFYCIVPTENNKKFSNRRRSAISVFQIRKYLLC